MITIIIPVYNSEDYLTVCLESVIRQTYKDFECIIVDDGSKDNSLSIAKDYENRDVRFRVYHKENGGVSSARNYGIERAKGDYIYFVDSDDELYEDALSVLVFHISEDVDLVFGGYTRYDNSGRMIDPVKKVNSFVATPKEAMDLIAYPKRYYFALGMPWLNLFKKSLIMRNNLRYNEQYSIYEDLLFLVSYICVCRGNVAFTTQPIYKYFCQQSGSIMNTRYKEFKVNTLNTLDGRIAVLDAARRFGKSRKMIYQAQLAVFYTYHDLVSYVRRFNRSDLEPILRQKVDNVISQPLFLTYTIRDILKRLIKMR